MKIEQEIAFRIKKVMKQKKVSQQTLANALGISRTTLTHILTGRSGISVSKIMAIADVLQEDTKYLTGGIVASGQDFVRITNNLSILIPLIKLQEAPKWREIMESVKADPAYPVIPVNAQRYNQNCYFQYVETAIMSPIFKEGEELIIDPLKEPKNQDYVIASIKDSNEVILRQYYKEGSRIYLKALNDLPIIDKHQDDIDIHGVVVGKNVFFG